MTITATVIVPIDTLRPHPRNYRTHTPAQLEHLRQSIREHGLYRNIVVANDDTIVAGHGVVEAARSMGFDVVPVIRLPVAPDDPRALKVLVGDNAIGQLAAIDDRELTTMLRDIHASELTDLLGTGFDTSQLAALVMVSRPASEIADFDAAAEWVGLPEYDPGERSLHVVVNCATDADRDAFLAFIGAGPEHLVRVTPRAKSVWWPLRVKVKTADVPVFDDV